MLVRSSNFEYYNIAFIFQLMINEPNKKQHIHQVQKTTTGDEQKKQQFLQKLVSHNPESFRQIEIDDFDLNITEHFEELQYIDDYITPLIYCAYYGLKEIAKFLMKNKKIDIDLETNNNRQTPLIVACMRGNYEMARMMLIGGAQVNKPNALNHTPLIVTIFRLIEEPYSFQNNRMCFRLAEYLINHGADINWIIDKKKGYSLLHYFCSIKLKLGKIQKELNFQIIKFLIKNGADVKQRTLKDETAEELLKKHCNKQNILILLKQGEQYGEKLQKIPKHSVPKLGENYFKSILKKS